MRFRAVSVAVLLLTIACGDSPDGGTDSFNVTLSHTFDPIPIEVGEESSGLCQRWTLNNDEPLYVTKVRQTNEGAWHHSNWFFIPEDQYVPGDGSDPDGTFRCGDRNWSEVAAAALGGVFFAQSTQAFEEVQAFPDGAALEIPPRSAIAGDIHLVNVSATPLDSALTMDIETLPADRIDTLLHPISFTNRGLAIPPGREARHAMTCDLGTDMKAFVNPVDEYSIYYVLAHYHQWGNYFKLSFMDEMGGEKTIFELINKFGEPIGSTIDPPISSDGMPLLRVECGYMNTTDRMLTYGLAGFEMCVFLAYTEAPVKIGKDTAINTPVGETEDGILLNEGGCENGITLEVRR